MTTRTEKRSSLNRRVRKFYSLLNRKAFAQCFQMIDPRLRRQPSSVTLFQYGNALAQFLFQCGSVKVVEINFNLHLNEPTELYEGRDFAVGKTTWSDKAGERHVFLERWVWEERAWYTRSTGFVVPVAAMMIPLVLIEEPNFSQKRKVGRVRRGLSTGR